MTDLAEWDAFVSEALKIRESAKDKHRRLRQLQRDILGAEELSAEESTELLRRLYAVLPRERSAR